jgi:hypothetical protein
MGSRPLLEIACIICAKPLDLSLDLSANESGEAVHTDYSVRRLISAHNHPSAVEKPFDILSGQPTSLRCPKCGLPVLRVNTTFLSQQGSGGRFH